MHKGDVIIYMLFSFVVEEFSTSIFIQVSRKKIKTYNDHCTSSVSWNLALGLLGTLERERVSPMQNWFCLIFHQDQGHVPRLH